MTYSNLSDTIRLWDKLDYILDYLFNAKKRRSLKQKNNIGRTYVKAILVV